ncbi:MAG: PAS domain S-box protein [Thermoplasmata archaeon]|nr:MAG: PAS domain S-box protein [Thermoplasmata archaeon]
MMGDEDENKIKAFHHIKMGDLPILTALGCGVLYWILESLLHALIFQEGNLFSQIFTPDPHEIWMRLLVISIIIMFGSYVQFIINKRKQDERRIKAINKELDQIFNTAADGMRLIDKDFTVFRINETFSNLIGLDKDEIIGKKCYETFRGPFCHTEHCPLKKIFNGEEYVECDVEKERNDGTKIPCIVTATPFRGPDGELLGIVEDFKDITEREQAKKKLAQHAEELARSNAELQQFAYVASHDLQEPLRMVASYVQLLARRYKGKLDADADDFINFAVDGATRMHNLINDLLAYSRVGTRGNDFGLTDCTAVLNQAIANLQPVIEENKAIITHTCLPTIMADETQLVQLFQNLISNAIKFHGNEPPQIHVSAERKENGWQFSVRDNGIGIDPEYAKRIFVIFQRLHNKTEHPGTGIGLAICKKIVGRHGGIIWVESECRKGAIFYFTIPNKARNYKERVLRIL